MTKRINMGEYFNLYMIIKNFYGEGESRFKEYDNEFNRFFLDYLGKYNTEIEGNQIKELRKIAEKDYDNMEKFFSECIKHKVFPNPGF